MEIEADLRQHARRQEALLRISRAVQEMARPSDLEQAMQVCLEGVKEIGLDAQAMAIHRMIDPERRIVETFRVGPGGPISAFQRRKATTVARCWQNGQVLYNEDHAKTPEESELLRNRFGGLPIRSHVNVPFSQGVISAHSVRPRAFSESDMETLKQVAEIFSVGFSRMEDLERVEASRRALQESEEKYRTLVENQGVGIGIVDPEERFTFVNQAAGEVFGVPPQELIGHCLKDFLDADQFEVIRRQTERRRQGEKSNYEVVITRPDGERRWILVTATPQFDAERRFTGTFGVFHDITEQKRAEEALRRSETINRAILDGIPDLMFRISRDGVYLDFRPAKGLEPLLPPSEFLGKKMHEVMPAEIAQQSIRFIGKALETGEVQFFEYELPMGGEVCDFEARIVAIGREEVLAMVRDITGRKRMEEAIRQSQERFQALIENSSDVVVLLSAEGTIRYVSPAITRLLGFSPEERVGRNFFELIHPDDRAYLEALSAQVLQQPKATASGVVRCRHRDGSWRWIEGVGANLLSEPGVGAIVLNYRDITERKQLEEQLRQAQKMEAVGRLAGGIAHDFNNLLQVITGFSELLLARLDPGDASLKEVEEIRKAGNRAASLTRQLLAFGRRQVLRPEALDLNALVSSMGRMLRRLISEDVDLVTVLRPGLGRVKADPGQVEQVIVNLAVNARDAMPEGGKLTIETENVHLDEAYVREHPDSRPGPHVRLAVRDTGCGIGAEVRPHLFEPFFTTKEEGKGTGLGLATVYGIVTQSGGSVAVSSEPGKGSTFSIYLPRVEDPLEMAPSEDALAELPRGSETLLLVEDDDLVRNLVCKILRKCGYVVLEASDSSEALRVSGGRQGPIHLMVTDVVMPRVNGHELAQHLLPLRPEMKVLYISGYTDDAVLRRDAMEAGVHFLQKPFTPDALARKVREVIDA